MKGSTTALKIFLPYFFDIVAPFLAYLVAQQFGARTILALTVGGLIAAASTAVNTIRRKGLDRIGMLVILEIVVSIVMLLVVHDARLLLIRPSFYTAVAAVYLIYTVFVGRPLSYDGARPMATQGDPVRMEAYEKMWDQSAEFRRTHRLVTFGFGLALMVDSILRIIIVYRLPIERSAWLSNVPHAATILLIVAVSAMAGRRFRRIGKSLTKAAITIRSGQLTAKANQG
jgi:hypothetical protein